MLLLGLELSQIQGGEVKKSTLYLPKDHLFPGNSLSTSLNTPSSLPSPPQAGEPSTEQWRRRDTATTLPTGVQFTPTLPSRVEAILTLPNTPREAIRPYLKTGVKLDTSN